MKGNRAALQAALILALSVGMTLTAAPARALPNVAVVDGAAASSWLTAAGVQHTLLTPEQVLNGGLATTQILVVPVDRVRSSALAQAVVSFVRRGGAVLAIYWGPLVREGSESEQPCYVLQEVIGGRPTGWRGTGPVAIRLEPSAPRGESTAAETPLPRGILVTFRPAEETQILGRWTPGGSTTPEQDVAIVRAGSVIYTGLDLFATPNDTPAVRQLFLWMFGLLAPNLAFEQAREKASTAMAASIRADAQLTQAEMQFPNVNFSPVRQLLEQARDAATQAKERVNRERFRESAAAVEVSQTALQKALELLKKLTMKGK